MERLDPAGAPFAPDEHHAVEHLPPDDAEEQATPRGHDACDGPHVVAVLRPGYRWRGRLVRPAMVRVRG